MNTALHTLSDAFCAALEQTAKNLGRDAGESAATWVPIDDETAPVIVAGIVDDIDPAVMDAIAPPDLSMTWGDGQSIDGVWSETLSDVWADHDGPDPVAWVAEHWLLDPICEAWERGIVDAFYSTVGAAALEYVTVPADSGHTTLANSVALFIVAAVGLLAPAAQAYAIG